MSSSSSSSSSSSWYVQMLCVRIDVVELVIMNYFNRLVKIVLDLGISQQVKTVKIVLDLGISQQVKTVKIVLDLGISQQVKTYSLTNRANVTHFICFVISTKAVMLYSAFVSLSVCLSVRNFT